jgi:hypothetical protein
VNVALQVLIEPTDTSSATVAITGVGVTAAELRATKRSRSPVMSAGPDPDGESRSFPLVRAGPVVAVGRLRVTRGAVIRRRPLPE